MIFLSKDDEDLLHKITEEVSAKHLQKQWEKVMGFTPMPSGTPQEEAAIQYMKQTLEEYGLEPQVLRYNAYISIPLEAQLTVISPNPMEVQCNPYRCVASTPAEGVEADLVYIHRDDLGKVECADRIVLTQELRTGPILTLQEMGARGIVAISRDTFMPEVIHQSADFSVSGNPTPDNRHLIPQLPMVKVSNVDGELLKGICQQGPVRVHMKAVVDTGWKVLPLLVAEIKGVKDPERFVLVNGHVDTPPFSPGVTDNASGIVALMELARVFNKHGERLGRSLRFAWWTGHEIGRYAGSTWYNDTFWHDLRYRCVGFFNIDSPGAERATTFRPVAIGEVQELSVESIKAETGIEVKSFRWPNRAGDSSFWGTGIPHTRVRSTRPEGEADPFVGFSGLGWWWHTPWATMDRGDIDILATDVTIGLNYIFRMTNCPVLPMNFVPYADAMLEILEGLQAKADKVSAYFHLHPVIEGAREFRALAESLEDAVKRALERGAPEAVLEELNRCIMWVSRHINLIAHSDAGKTEQLSMETFGATPFPRIHEILKLAEMPLPYTSEFKLLQTKLLRQRNMVEDGFYIANELIRETLAKVEKNLA